MLKSGKKGPVTILKGIVNKIKVNKLNVRFI